MNLSVLIFPMAIVFTIVVGRMIQRHLKDKGFRTEPIATPEGTTLRSIIVGVLLFASIPLINQRLPDLYPTLYFGFPLLICALLFALFYVPSVQQPGLDRFIKYASIVPACVCVWAIFAPENLNWRGFIAIMLVVLFGFVLSLFAIRLRRSK